jgi:hypothetical protein
MTSLVTPSGRLDRRAVMIEAHRQFRLMRRYDWSFGRCLSFAWAKARERRARTNPRFPLPNFGERQEPLARGRTELRDFPVIGFEAGPSRALDARSCARESPRLFFKQANGCTARRHEAARARM